MANKRQDITAAADRLFYQEGFAAVGIDRVAQAANVALGTLYRHFRGRSAVIVGALEHRHAAYMAVLEQTAPAGGAEGVLALFDALAAWSTAQGGNGCFFLRAALDHPHDEEVHAAVLANKQACLALIVRRLVAGDWDETTAERLAPAIFLLLEGAVSAAFTLDDETAIGIARELANQLLQARGAAR